MFDLERSFAAQFTPVDGGYLYYPSRKAGGRLITIDEYHALFAKWRQKSNPWKVAFVALVLIGAWTIVSDAFALPNWSEQFFIGLMVAAVCGWTYWALYAPRRLVKDRPEVAPPRPLSESRRRARAALDWPMVLFFLLASAAIFVVKLIDPQHTLNWWAWTVGSGLMFLAYLRISLLKFRDRKR